MTSLTEKCETAEGRLVDHPAMMRGDCNHEHLRIPTIRSLVLIYVQTWSPDLKYSNLAG